MKKRDDFDLRIINSPFLIHPLMLFTFHNKNFLLVFVIECQNVMNAINNSQNPRGLSTALIVKDKMFKLLSIL